MNCFNKLKLAYKNNLTPQDFRKRMLILYIMVSIWIITLLFAINSTLDVDLKKTILISLLYLFMMSALYIILYAECASYTKTLNETRFSTTTLILMFVFIISYICQPIYALYFLADKYMFYVYMVIIIISIVYCAVSAVYMFKEKFSEMYFEINKYIFFNYVPYDTIKRKVSGIYCTICALIGIHAAAHGFYAKSFYDDNSYGIAFGITIIVMILLGAYPIFIRGVYARIVHAKVERRFNKKIISDKWGLLEKNPELAERILGKNPVKRPIRYEEVFCAESGE